MGIYRFGTSTLPLTYTQQELIQKVTKLIDGMSVPFSFQNLCQRILVTAEHEGKLKKEVDTEYSMIQLTPNDIMAISQILWDMIWERKIYIVFDAYPFSRENQNTLFAIVQK